MATQLVEFPYTSGATMTAKAFAIGDDKSTIVQTASAVDEQSDATPHATGRYVATFTDLTAGDYLLVAYVTNVGVTSFKFTTTGASETVQPWSEHDRVLEELGEIEGGSFNPASHSLSALGTAIGAVAVTSSGLASAVAAMSTKLDLALANLSRLNSLIGGAGDAIEIWIGADHDGVVRDKIEFTVHNEDTDLSTATGGAFRVYRDIPNSDSLQIFEITNITVTSLGGDDYTVSVDNVPAANSDDLDVLYRYSHELFLTVAGSTGQVAAGKVYPRNHASFE